VRSENWVYRNAFKQNKIRYQRSHKPNLYTCVLLCTQLTVLACCGQTTGSGRQLVTNRFLTPAIACFMFRCSARIEQRAWMYTLVDRCLCDESLIYTESHAVELKQVFEPDCKALQLIMRSFHRRWQYIHSIKSFHSALRPGLRFKNIRSFFNLLYRISNVLFGVNVVKDQGL